MIYTSSYINGDATMVVHKPSYASSNKPEVIATFLQRRLEAFAPDCRRYEIKWPDKNRIWYKDR